MPQATQKANTSIFGAQAPARKRNRLRPGAEAPAALVIKSAIHIAQADFAAPFGPLEELHCAVLLSEKGARFFDAGEFESDLPIAGGDEMARGALRELGLSQTFQCQSWRSTQAGPAREICLGGLLSGPQAESCSEGRARLRRWQAWMNREGALLLRERGLALSLGSLVWRETESAQSDAWQWGPLASQWEERVLGLQCAGAGDAGRFRAKARSL